MKICIGKMLQKSILFYVKMLKQTAKITIFGGFFVDFWYLGDFVIVNLQKNVEKINNFL